MNRKFVAFAMVVIMLVAPVTLVTFSDDEDDSDANPLVRAGGTAIKWGIKHQKEIRQWINTLSVVFIGIPLVKELIEDDGSLEEDALRIAEAKMLAESMVSGVTQYANAVENYANIWGLTSEHWIRQAELASASYWTSDSDYSTYNAMTGSLVWYNSAILMENAVSQMNEQFSEVAKHIGKWNDSSVSECYGDGKMTMSFVLGGENVTVDSNDDLVVRMCTVIRSTDENGSVRGDGYAYFVGGPLYASKACTITSVQGNAIYLTEGWNDLPGADVSDQYDVYLFPGGIDFCGTILPVNMSGAAPVKAGMFVSGGGNTMVLTCYNGAITSGDSEQGDLVYRITPQNADDLQEKDISAMLLNYEKLLREVNIVMNDANQAARVVWNIYDEHGRVSAYLTTLTVPETYKNVTLTDQQKQLIVTMAMQQLAEWYSETSPSGVRHFTMTQDSLSLYCRGSITVRGTSASSSGTENTVYENAIFTPIFYTDQTIRIGDNTYSSDQYGFVVVWGTGTSLSGFDETSTEYTDLIWVGNGATLQIAEMRYSGESVSSVDLDATNVDYIQPIDMDDPDPIQPADDTDGMVRLFAVVFGLLIVLVGFTSGSRWAMLLGVVVLVIGLVFADPIAGVITDRFGCRFVLPEIGFGGFR